MADLCNTSGTFGFVNGPFYCTFCDFDFENFSFCKDS